MEVRALAFASATELVARLRAGSVSSRELLELHLERVAAAPELNAVVTVEAEAARRAADEADARRAAGAALGPLHGLPMTVKDCFETAGMRTTAGAPALADYVPERDAVAVARLRAAGAVIFGKTNTPTWAGDWQTTNPVFGRTRNPHDLDRTPGGSSGGSAAAVAAGLTPLELGSDIGGSIRVPSHWSGVCGHKPTHGVVPQRGHLPGPPGSLAEADLNVVGPLARCVSDLELALDVLAGPLPEDAAAWRLSLPPARGRSLGDFRVGVWIDDAAYPVDPAVGDVLSDAADALAKGGAQLAAARPDVDFRAAVDTYLELLMPLNTRVSSDAEWQGLCALAEAAGDAEGLLPHLLRAHVISHHEWLRADEARLHVKARWCALFDQVDVVLCPVGPVPAIPHDDAGVEQRVVRIGGEPHPYVELIAWPAIVTMAGLPATVVPMGRTASGRSSQPPCVLPVGGQLVGAPHADRTTLAFARAAEAQLGGFLPPAAYAAPDAA